MQFVALIAAACEMYRTMRLIAGTLKAGRGETSPRSSWTQPSHVGSAGSKRTRDPRGVCVMRVSDCLTREATLMEGACGWK